MSECIYYVYAYINKRTGKPYYIGKGKGRRAYTNHNYINVPKDKSKIVFLEKNLTEIGAFALERRYIHWWGKKNNGTGILLNTTDGGEGVHGLRHNEKTRFEMSKKRIGVKKTEAHKQKISQALKGMIKSDEHRKHHSESLKGKPSWNKGLKNVQSHTSETRDVLAKHFSKLKWWTNGIKTMRSEECPGPDWKLGRKLK